MSDFGYVNARLRAMRARRLSSKQLEALVNGDLDAMADGLSGTPYGDALAENAGGANNLPAIDRAISSVVHATLGKCIKMIGNDEETVPFSIYLSRTQVHNLRVVVRAVRDGGGYEKAEPALIPLAPLGRRELEELCGQEDIMQVAAMLMTWGVPFGSALVRALREHGDDPSTTALDHALDQTFYSKAIAALEDEADEDMARPVIDALKDEVDLANLRVALKVAYSGGGALPVALLTSGRLSEDSLKRIAGASSLADAAAMLEGTAFRAASKFDVAGAAGRNDLGAVERVLERVRLRRMATRSLDDPLGLGFTLRCLAETDTEAQNLRLAARACAGLIPARAAEEAMIHV